MLEKNRFVKVREFKGRLFVDIREFYEKNGELLPGKKGMFSIIFNVLIYFKLYYVYRHIIVHESMEQAEGSHWWYSGISW